GAARDLLRRRGRADRRPPAGDRRHLRRKRLPGVPVPGRRPGGGTAGAAHRRGPEQLARRPRDRPHGHLRHRGRGAPAPLPVAPRHRLDPGPDRVRAGHPGTLRRAYVEHPNLSIFLRAVGLLAYDVDGRSSPVVIVTISWQLGIDGERVGALLGERLGVPVVDGEVVDAVMHALRTGRADAADMERFVPTWSANLAVSLLATAGMPAARADVIRAECAHTAVEAVIREAARRSCVIMGRGGFAILADHPGACHVRLTAPVAWRAARLAACECLPAEQAERRIESDDRNRAAFVRHYHH